MSKQKNSPTTSNQINPQCKYCKQYGHEIKNCLKIKKKTNSNNTDINKTHSNNTNKKKLYCSICSKTGHSVKTCRNNLLNKKNNGNKKQGFFKWQWEDDNKIFQDYSKEISINLNKLKTNSSTTVKINNKLYLITRTSISTGTQVNQETQYKRNIKSVKVNTKKTFNNSIKKNINKSTKKNINKSTKKNSPQNSITFPKWWTRQKNFDHTERYSLIEENKFNNYIIKKAKEFYSKTMSNSSKITKIWMVQNASYWKEHKDLESNWKLSRRVDKTNIQYLFHGTNYNVIKNEICKNGFNRNYNKTYAYGRGVYFARDASYSMSGYSVLDSNTNSYYLLYCRVLCGESCQGNSGMMGPIDKSNGYKYETMVNTTTNPSIYVTTTDKQAYPLMLFQISP